MCPPSGNVVRSLLILGKFVMPTMGGHMGPAPTAEEEDGWKLSDIFCCLNALYWRGIGNILR